MPTQTIDVRVVDKTQRALRNISTRLDNLNKGLLGINRVAGLAVTALAAIGGGNLIRNIVNTTARYEDLRTTLTSVTGSARAGADAFKFIQEFATQTQFGVEELTQTYIKLQAAGIEPTTELLTTFTDAAAITTDQLGSLQAITDLFSRTVSGGLGIEELERLGDRGIPVYRILQEEIGKSRNEITELGKTADGARLITEALAKGIQDRFGGATLARLNNVSTQFSNLQIAITNASDTIGRQGFALALGEAARKITDLITNNETLVKSIGLNLTRAFLYASDVAVFLGQNIGLIGKAFAVLFGLKVAAWAISLSSVFLSALIPALRFVARGAALAAEALFGMLTLGTGTLIKGLIKGILAIASAVGLITLATGDALDGFEDLKDSVAKMATETFGVEGLDELRKGFETNAARAEELQAKANEITDAVVGTGNAAAGTSNELRDQVDALGLQKKTFDEILQAATRQNAEAAIGLEQNQVTQALKRAELDLGRNLTDEERQKLAVIYQQNDALRQQAELEARIASATDTLLQNTISYAEEEAKVLDAARDRAINNLKTRLDEGKILEGEYLASVQNIHEQHATRLYEINKQLQDRNFAYAEMTLRKTLEATMSNERYLQQYNNGSIAQRIRGQEQLEEIVNDRIEFEKKSELEKTQFGLEKANEFFTGMTAYNKKFARIQKAIAISQAIINTYQGATKALATYPPPFNFIAAAATVASGLAQVAAIRAQPYQRGGDMVTGQTALVGEDGPELIVPKQPSTVIPREVAQAIEGMGGGRKEPVVVNFNITTVDAEGFDELLISRRGTITGIINQAMQSRGRVGVV